MLSKIVINQLGKLSDNTAITIGVFDGVHLGHIHIINKMLKISRMKNLPSLVITFTPHTNEVVFKKREGIENKNWSITRIVEAL